MIWMFTHQFLILYIKKKLIAVELKDLYSIVR